MIDPEHLGDDLVEELAMPSGAVDGLRPLERGLLLARLMTIVLSAGDASRALPPSLATTWQQLVPVLVEMEAQDAESLLGSPRAMSWMSRLARALVDPDRPANLLAALVEPAPMLLAAVWPDDRAECDLTLAPHGSIAPFGSPWLLRSDSPAPLRLRARVVSGRVDFLGPDGAPVAALSPESAHASGPVRVEPARRFENLAIELLDDADYPELVTRRGPGESRSSLQANRIEAELAAALDVIAQAWPEARRAVDRAARGVLPLGMVQGHWNSASTSQLPYVVQVTVRDRGTPLLLAESLVHECSHIRLDLAMAVTPLLIDDGEKRFSHPWRPDPRPITGVLLGAHAFLAVLELYRRAERSLPDDPMIGREIETRTREVGVALRSLEEAPFTPLGERLFAVMQRRFAAPAYGR